MASPDAGQRRCRCRSARRSSARWPFETIGDITVQPFEGRVYHQAPAERRRARSPERGAASASRSIYGIAVGEPYVTTPLFADGQADAGGPRSCSPTSVDQALWIALLAPTAEARDGGARGAFEQASPRCSTSASCRASCCPIPTRTAAARAAAAASGSGRSTSARPAPAGAVDYIALEVEQDDTARPRPRGHAAAAAAAGIATIGLPANDVDADVGPASATGRRASTIRTLRRACWPGCGCGRPAAASALPLAWLGINAVAIDQRTTLRDIVVGTGDRRRRPGGAAAGDARSTRHSLVARGRGRRPRLRALARGSTTSAACGRDDRVLRARRRGRHRALRRRRTRPRAGDGRAHRARQACAPAAARAGNLPPGTLAGDRSTRGLDCAAARRRRPAARMPRRSTGGRAAHHLGAAPRRSLRHRATTTEALAFETPGVALGAGRGAAALSPVPAPLRQSRHGLASWSCPARRAQAAQPAPGPRS